MDLENTLSSSDHLIGIWEGLKGKSYKGWKYHLGKGCFEISSSSTKCCEMLFTRMKAFNLAKIKSLNLDDPRHYSKLMEKGGSVFPSVAQCEQSSYNALLVNKMSPDTSRTLTGIDRVINRRDAIMKLKMAEIALVKKDRYTEYTHHTPSIGENKLVVFKGEKLKMIRIYAPIDLNIEEFLGRVTQFTWKITP